MIIVLTGTSSSGKSTLCYELKKRLDDHWLSFSTDGYLSMLGEKFLSLHPDNLTVYEPNPVCYAKKHNDGTFEIMPGELCSKLYKTIPDMLDLLANQGFHIIVDSFISNREELNLYKNRLEKHKILFIYLHASEKEINRREAVRGDRLQGSAIHWLRKFDFQNDCNMCLDTEKIDLFDCCSIILEKFELK